MDRVAPHHLGHVLGVWPQVGGVGGAVAGLLEASEAAGHDGELIHVGAATVASASWADAHIPGPLTFQHDQLWAAVRGRLDTVDVLVLHGVFNPSCSRIAHLVRRHAPGVRLVAMSHDSYDTQLFARHAVRKQLYWRSVEKAYLSSVDLIQVSAPSHVAWLRSRGVRTPTNVAPPGLTDPQLQRARSIAQTLPDGPSGGSTRLLFLGRWDVEHKGIDLLCDALDARRGSDLDIALRLVGPPIGRRGDVDRLVREHRVSAEAVGWVPDVWRELAETDLLVLPSRKEGFGLVALQALACGIPAVVTTCSGIAEYVSQQDGAVISDPTATGLHDAIAYAVAHLDVLRESARRFSQDRASTFTYHAMLRSMMDAVHAQVLQ